MKNINNNPLVSVIMPAYKSLATIRGLSALGDLLDTSNEKFYGKKFSGVDAKAFFAKYQIDNLG